MKITIEYGNGVLSLPISFMNYIDKASELGIKLMLTLASDISLCEDADRELLARKFAVSEDEIEKALEFLKRAGLIEISDGKPKSRVSVKKHTAKTGADVTVIKEGSPSYTGEEIERIVSGNPKVSSLINSCSSIAGKIFSTSESTKLIGLYDYLGLDPEYIIMLFSYCKSIDRLSVHYLEKTAYSLYNEGITTYTALEGYLTVKEKQNSFEGKIRSLIGAGERAFTSKEKKFISLWCDMDLPLDMLTLAYEVTVNNTGAASMPYMNKVISNWREAGYKNAEDVKRATEEYKRKKENEASGSFNTDEFFEAALRRSLDEMNGINS